MAQQKEHICRTNQSHQGSQVSEELMMVQEELQEAYNTLSDVEMQKKVTERLSGLVLVHYFDEAVPAALVLQKNAREFLNRKRARTESPEKTRCGSDEGDLDSLGMTQLGFSGLEGGELGESGAHLEAATVLQAQYRGQQVRKQKAQESQHMTMLQKHVRGHITRQRLSRQQEASSLIGRQVRGHLVRQELHKKNEAAHVIGRSWKSKKGAPKETTQAAAKEEGLPLGEAHLEPHGAGWVGSTAEAMQYGLGDGDGAVRGGSLNNSASMGSMDFLVDGITGLQAAGAAGGEDPAVSPSSSLLGELTSGFCLSPTEPQGGLFGATSHGTGGTGSMTGQTDNHASSMALDAGDVEEASSREGAVAFQFGAGPSSVAQVQLQAIQTECRSLQGKVEANERVIRAQESELRVQRSTVQGLQQMVHHKDAQLKLASEQLQQSALAIQSLQSQLRQLQQQQQMQTQHSVADDVLDEGGVGEGGLERAPSTGDSFSDFIMSDAFGEPFDTAEV